MSDQISEEIADDANSDNSKEPARGIGSNNFLKNLQEISKKLQSVSWLIGMLVAVLMGVFATVVIINGYYSTLKQLNEFCEDNNTPEGDCDYSKFNSSAKDRDLKIEANSTAIEYLKSDLKKYMYDSDENMAELKDRVNRVEELTSVIEGSWPIAIICDSSSAAGPALFYLVHYVRNAGQSAIYRSIHPRGATDIYINIASREIERSVDTDTGAPVNSVACAENINLDDIIDENRAISAFYLTR